MNVIYIERILSSLSMCINHLEEKDKSQISEKFLLRSHGSVLNEFNCVLALNGDSIYDADIKLKRPNHILYKTSIKEEFGDSYKLQQIQDCLNLITYAFNMLHTEKNHGNIDCMSLDYKFISEVFNYLRDAKDVLTNPRRQSIEEHKNNPKRKCFHPTVPSDLAISIFLRDSTLILAAYLLEYSQNKRHELAGRIAVECEVPWISEVLNHLTYSINTCLFVMNKIKKS